MPRTPKERPMRTKEDWDRFMRERQRAEYAITNREFFSFVGKFIVAAAIAALVAHLNGRF
jgi:hypothetical protein